MNLYLSAIKKMQQQQQRHVKVLGASERPLCIDLSPNLRRYAMPPTSISLLATTRTFVFSACLYRINELCAVKVVRLPKLSAFQKPLDRTPYERHIGYDSAEILHNLLAALPFHIATVRVRVRGSDHSFIYEDVMTVTLRLIGSRSTDRPPRLASLPRRRSIQSIACRDQAAMHQGMRQ